MRAALVLLLLLGALVPRLAGAHGMRTAAISLDELEPGTARVQVRLSVPDPSFRFRIPESCQLSDAVSEGELRHAFTLRCPSALAGQTLGVMGLGPVLGEAVLSLSLHDGRALSHLLLPDAPSWRIPEPGSTLSVAVDYVRLGVEHILAGPDHLLLLVLLVLVLRSPRAVLLAETAFTLSHSLTFAATALGWIHVPSAWAEACIALSLVLLALDVERPGLPAPSALRGAASALVFGLVHGLGFAGGLQELGLPEQAVLPALVGFGAGVELGQVLFLAGVLLVASLAARLKVWPRLVLAGGYAAGAVSSCWLLQRVWLCLAR
ncbi:HupE/UreJ family protein [Hyalangium gracile]|uniref:HupE/UreJ family protein n=1 Tax=Hyalangium gracile TaxID=394092 RepID=UPI001CCC6454|nr:HupE/UreJ family protein [Hyalangium gracile]